MHCVRQSWPTSSMSESAGTERRVSVPSATARPFAPDGRYLVTPTGVVCQAFVGCLADNGALPETNRAWLVRWRAPTCFWRQMSHFGAFNGGLEVVQGI